LLADGCVCTRLDPPNGLTLDDVADRRIAVAASEAKAPRPDLIGKTLSKEVKAPPCPRTTCTAFGLTPAAADDGLCLRLPDDGLCLRLPDDGLCLRVCVCPPVACPA